MRFLNNAENQLVKYAFHVPGVQSPACALNNLKTELIEFMNSHFLLGPCQTPCKRVGGTILVSPSHLLVAWTLAGLGQSEDTIWAGIGWVAAGHSSALASREETWPCLSGALTRIPDSRFLQTSQSFLCWKLEGFFLCRSQALVTLQRVVCNPFEFFSFFSIFDTIHQCTQSLPY